MLSFYRHPSFVLLDRTGTKEDATQRISEISALARAALHQALR